MDFVFGVDVYAYNKPSDWVRAREAGVKFVFVKASENNFPDPGFADNWQKARQAGILRGAYHFFHPEVNNASQQAEMFIESVGSDKGELPPVLDLETIYERRSNGEVRPIGLPMPSVLLTRIKTWLDEVEAAFNRKPIIYSREEFLRSTRISRLFQIPTCRNSRRDFSRGNSGSTRIMAAWTGIPPRRTWISITSMARSTISCISPG